MKKEYRINVKHVYNRLVVFLNGETIWDSGIVHDDPELNQFINITDQLHIHSSHLNELIFEGFNDFYTSDSSNGDLNPWHFHYRVFKRTVDTAGNMTDVDLLSPYNEKHLSNPNTRAINNRYQIIRNDEEFKVISNSLSQNFYN